MGVFRQWPPNRSNLLSPRPDNNSSFRASQHENKPGDKVCCWFTIVSSIHVDFLDQSVEVWEGIDYVSAITVLAIQVSLAARYPFINIPHSKYGQMGEIVASDITE